MKLAKYAAALVVLGATSVAAAAAPGGIRLDTGVDAPSLVDKTHGGHRACVAGPAGWHYHAGRRGNVRVACGRSPGRGWAWTYRGGRYGWWHGRDRRWR